MTVDKTWHEDDEFWETFTSTVFSERRLKDAEEDVGDLIVLLGLGPGSRVLDLCCGIGRYSLELTKRGYKVTGVDRTGGYLDIARKNAAEQGHDIEYIEGDMRTFSRPDTFDAVVNLFTSFGFFEDPEEDRQVLRNAHQSLKPGGVLIVDVMGKETIARIYQERDWREEEDGTLLLQERKVAKDWSWLDNRWILIAKDGSRKEFDFSHTLYSARELKEMLEECGFKDVKAYGDFKGAPYDQTARRLAVVGRK